MSGFELILRIFFSLLAVMGLMWGLARLARRPLGGRGGGTITVLARQQLTRSSSVAVVQVVDKALVLGVTEAQISLLGEADLAALRPPAGYPAPRAGGADPTDPDSPVHPTGPLAGSLLSPRTWRQTLDALRERTARR